MKAAEEVDLGGGGLQRNAHLRAMADRLHEDPAARVLPFWRGRPLVAGGAGRTRLVTMDAAQAFLTDHGGALVYLGSGGEGPLFAQDVSGWKPDSTTAADAGPGRSGADEPVRHIPGLPEDARFADFRGLIAQLTRLEAEITATAKGILEWHQTHGFCASCGAPTRAEEGGWQRDCPKCGRRHFPRTDPVVIMLVTRGNSVLVGRSPGWPEGFYSLLAGFMEPGETVAGAVRREVAEESGVKIGAVRMLSSQPWPFPASLMIGCAATALSAEITLDPRELEDAVWLSREEMLDVFAGTHHDIAAPRPGAIAYHLLKMWLADRLD